MKKTITVLLFAPCSLLSAFRPGAAAEKVPRVGYVSGVAIPTMPGLRSRLPARVAGSRLY